MAEPSRSRQASYTLDRAVDEVFGRLPLWPWSAIAVIVLGGVVGGTALPKMTAAGPAFRWAACAGYGAVAAALLTALPLSLRVVRLRAALAKRPPEDERDVDWWPLRLLAAALRGTPDATRRTQQDFSTAVERAAASARGIVSYRLWPAWVAAFVAPVLGLLSAWEAGKQIDVRDADTTGQVLAQFVPQVSPPMVATIAAALGLMVVLAILDQVTKGLLGRWATAVVLSDGRTAAVRDLAGEGLVAADPARAGLPTGPKPPPRVDEAQAAPPAGPNADDLERLAEAFSSRGKGG